MSSYLSTNLKRKDLDLDLDHLDDDAFDFTLHSPACKIRRLDADLPPIIEQGESDRPLPFEQQPLSEFCSSDVGDSRLKGLVIEELPSDENQERAIVLFKPMNTPLYHSPSNFVVDSDLISSFRDHSVWEINSKSSRSVHEKGSKEDEQLAVIPWVPYQQLHQVQPPEVSEMEVSEPMDAEEMGATMEAEENVVGTTAGVQSTRDFNQSNWTSSESIPPHQWQQQHCIIPQPPHNTTSPIVWYR